MKEVKKHLEKTIIESCEWIQEKLKNETMSPDVVAAIPETLKAINNMAETLLKYKNVI